MTDSNIKDNNANITNYMKPVSIYFQQNVFYFPKYGIVQKKNPAFSTNQSPWNFLFFLNWKLI